jgi:hypothetical protein
MPAGHLLLAAWLAGSTQAPGSAPADERVRAMLARTAEEATVFAQAAPDLVARETFEQRVLHLPRRFRPRLGGTTQPPKPQYRTREIVSEYGYANFRDSGDLHEFRQIVSVDGRQVAGAAKARETLAAGIRSADDRRKKRMLEDFQRHGLTSAATDFGQLILLFRSRNMADFRFAYQGSDRIGADPVEVLSFQQIGGKESLMILERRKAIRQPLEGQIWLRKPDLLPLRIVVKSIRKEREQPLVDEAAVDYVLSSHGILVPVSVIHRQFTGRELTVENIFRYSSFRKFGADAEIKFN